MVNGKQGDHPLTDIIVWQLPTYSAEVDALVREVDELGGWEGGLVGFLMSSFDSELRGLRERGAHEHAENLLHNFAFTLRLERDRLRGQRLGAPADLVAALAADDDAYRAFEALSPSHRREYVSWIDEAKRPETRERRITRAVEMLRAGD